MMQSLIVSQHERYAAIKALGSVPRMFLLVSKCPEL